MNTAYLKQPQVLNPSSEEPNDLEKLIESKNKWARSLSYYQNRLNRLEDLSKRKSANRWKLPKQNKMKRRIEFATTMVNQSSDILNQINTQLVQEKK